MVNIEIDGIPLRVDSSKMIIQAADEAGIDIPRFCYHKKLSIAANCRMCLIELDKSRKPVPACATPVTDGMKVFTHSKTAIAAQRSVMEFLLINHPLDCPICDQGGECELQDLSLGYGAGISRFTEGKRVVKDKDIGPLVQTDMTRCIHCTRCVRFGQEIAGIKELGAVGRGEHMEIGTYVEHSLASELSGNIIDICPVGALTSKPFRYKARAWEMHSHKSIAPHDAVGSNIELHIRQNEVMRVVPCENEAVNESWISDRDRFSYLGLKHADRALQPMIKRHGEWQTCDWQTAMEFAVEGLQAIKSKNGEDQLAGLMSPTATLEEGYLFQQWLRGLGTPHVDHRLRQLDFADEQQAYFNQSMPLEDIQQSDAILLVGCNLRAEMPIVAHRVRQAALSGALVNDINFFSRDLLMPVQRQLQVNNQNLFSTLKGIAAALLKLKPQQVGQWKDLLSGLVPTATEQNIAMQLANAYRGTLIVGALVNHHPQAAIIHALTDFISQMTESHLLILPEANSRALRLANVLPSRDQSQVGLNANAMWQRKLRAYVLFNVEPEFDTANPALAAEALQHAGFVVAINSFTTENLLKTADVILPLACFAETSGTFVGLDGTWQSFTGAVKPRGESRPGWKILRVLGNLSNLSGFEYVVSTDVTHELKAQLERPIAETAEPYLPDNLQAQSGLMRIAEVPMYRGDSLLRRSEALQKTPENSLVDFLRLNPAEAERLELTDGDLVIIRQGDQEQKVFVQLDEQLAEGCIYLAASTSYSARLGQSFDLVTLSRVVELADV